MSDTAASPAAPPLHEIVQVPSLGQPGRAALRDQCYAVRIAVFHHEQRFPLDTEIDDLDETAEHFLLRLVPSLQPIGTIRASRAAATTTEATTVPCYKLSRLAVLKDYRGHHFGRELVLALQSWVAADVRAQSPGALPLPATAQVVAHSQIPVKPFYARFGYAPEGPQFDEDGAPHQNMVLHLPLFH
ncbi:acyl-CoA N-acyltransferase [Gloeopeniophorella convolvens]|nr:acyl-CoA N-acyltransferase [Gloeopeniophorella convolvens]